MASRRRVKAGIAVGVAVLTVVGCVVAVAGDDGRRLSPRVSYGVFGGSAAAQEWVAYGDYAAVVTVVAEAAGRPDPKDDGYIPRTVTANVSQVIWSRPDAPRLAEGITLPAKGWHTTLWGGREEAAPQGAPRLEVGHTYVVGVTSRVGGMRLIGDDAAVPYDAETFGQGEFEGHAISPNAYRRGVRELAQDAVARFAVSETYNRKTVRDVQRLLEGTSPQNLYRQAALSRLYADANVDGKPDDHADEGAGDLPGRIRRQVSALDPGKDYFLAITWDGRGKAITLELTVNGTTTSRRLACNTTGDLVGIKQPRGEVTYEIAAEEPDIGAVAWNLSQATRHA